ncbi:RagB/SusD family nutrient uptake outer membrane protein [Flavitalea antarctica]
MKLFNYIIAFVLVSGSLSCKKFLDVTPQESVSDQQTIFDKASAETALRGVYSSVASEGYYGSNYQMIGYLSGDNIQWTGSQSQIQEFINHNVKSENPTVNGAWVAIYRTINRVNQVLDKVPLVEDALLTDSIRNKILGEAYFLRGLAYFDLARAWGGVPLILTSTSDPNDNVGTGRSSLDETYAQVLSDLERAEALLPARTSRFTVTKKTVYALKARYYLYRSDPVKAEEFATRLITDASSHSLVKPFRAFFATETNQVVRGTAESVFEIFYNGTTETNGHGSSWLAQTSGGTRQWAPNDIFVGLINDPLKGGNRNVTVAKDNQNRWFGNFYRTVNAAPSYVIRTAELYLIRAEARARQDKLLLARADLNAVRERAGLTASISDTKDALLLDIENERRLEFAFEPHRWFDLVRTGRAAAVLNVTDNNRLLMPIPAQQRILDDNLAQNPGY